jgi:hypothetical protein
MVMSITRRESPPGSFLFPPLLHISASNRWTAITRLRAADRPTFRQNERSNSRTLTGPHLIARKGVTKAGMGQGREYTSGRMAPVVCLRRIHGADIRARRVGRERSGLMNSGAPNMQQHARCNLKAAEPPSRDSQQNQIAAAAIGIRLGSARSSAAAIVWFEVTLREHSAVRAVQANMQVFTIE